MSEVGQIQLFISGFPRSGTTLLTSILGGSREVELVFEPDFFKEIHKMQLHEKVSIEMMLQHLALHGNKLKPSLQKALASQSILENAQQFEIGDFYIKLFGFKTRIIGDKSLSNIFYYKVIQDVFKNSKFIYIYRDPRDVIFSNLKKKGYSISDINNGKCNSLIINYCLKWKKWQQQSEKIPALITVKYENLILNHHENIKAIAKKIGIEHFDELLDYNRQKSIIEKIEGKSKVFHQNIGKAPDSNMIGQFVSSVDENVVRLTEGILFPYAQKFGYQPYYKNRYKNLIQIITHSRKIFYHIKSINRNIVEILSPYQL